MLFSDDEVQRIFAFEKKLDDDFFSKTVRTTEKMAVPNNSAVSVCVKVARRHASLGLCEARPIPCTI